MEELVELYISQQKSQLLDSLETQVRFSQLVALIVGEKGIGKSFLLEQLQNRLKNEIAVASVDASLAMSEDQLDKTISLQLGLSWQESELDISQRINDAHSQKVLICIDDAHLLSQNCIEFILKLNQSQLNESESKLFILLVGDKNLPRIISKTKTFTQHPDMCVVFEIEPIQKSETSQVIESLSHSNSDTLKGLKDNAKLDYFWQLSKGNPAELNYHVSRWLDDHSPTQVVEIKSQNQGTYVKASIYALLVIGLVSMLVYQDDINQWITGEESIIETFNDDPMVEEGKALVPSESKESTSSDSSNDKPKLVNYTEESEIPLEMEIKSDVKAPSTQTNKTESKERKTKLKEQITEPVKEQERVTQEKASMVVKAEPIIVPEQTLSSDELALLSLDASHLVLQWAGLSTQVVAEEYRNNHIAKDNMRIYRRRQNNKVLYLIVSDYYSNRALAEFAKNDYLQRGVKEKPWVKSVELVQKEIRAFKN